MLNHSHTFRVSYITDVQTKRFKLVANEAVSKGSQVFLNYGPRSNEKLLLNYGFILQDNFADTFFLKIGTAGDELSKRKISILKECNLGMEHYLTKGEHPVHSTLLDSIRILVMNERELYFFKYSAGAAISIRNEYTTLNTLKNLLQLKLKKFPTSINEDRELLKNATDATERNFITYRMGQKEILISSLNYVDKLQNEFVVKMEKELADWDKAALKDITDPKLITYEKWLKSNAAKQGWRHMLRDDGEVVMVAMDTIEEGKPVGVIPGSILITVDEAMNSSLGDALNGVEGVDEETILTLFLIQERSSPSSLWKHFFEALNMDNPILFTSEELELLQGTFLYEEVLSMKQEYQQEWSSMVDLLYQLEIFKENIHTWDNFLWARSILDSRSTTIQVEGEEVPVVMPLAVLPRFHPCSKLTHHFDENSETFSLKCNKRVLAGAQIFDDYGGDDHSMFLEYGIVMESALSDFAVEYEVTVDEHDPLASRKMKLMEKNGLGTRHFLKKGVLSEKLLAAMRIAVMTKDELKNHLKSKQFEFISDDNEQRMRNELLDNLKDMLEDLQTSEGKMPSSINPRRAKKISLYRNAVKEAVASSIQLLESK